MDAGGLRLECWPVRDTGLAAAPPRFRRLGGQLRHHRGHGEQWPGRVVVEVSGGRLSVEGVGSWPLADVSAEPAGDGPPVTFVMRVPGTTQLLAAPAGLEVRALLEVLTG